jgi:HK97 family phage major capsid protein
MTAAENKKALDDLLASEREKTRKEVAAEYEKKLTDSVDKSVGNALFGGVAAPQIVTRSYDAALDTKNMSAGQRAYLHAQRDPDTMHAMKQLGRIGIAIVRSQGRMEDANKYAKMLWPNDKLVHSAFEKALTVTDPSGGGFTVPMPILEPIIPFLYNRVAVRQLGATVYNLPNGNANVPRVNSTSAATYTPEAVGQNATGPVAGNVKLSVKKLIALVPLSNDLIISNSVNYEATVAQDLVNIMNIAADKASLYGSGVLNNPLGLINLGVQIAGTSTTPLDADQPYAIVGQLDQANVPMISPGWIVNGKTRAWLNNLKTSTGAYIYRDELREGELAGYPLVVSNQLNYTAAGTYADFVFGDFSEFMWGEQTLLELEQSREASYLDSTGTLVSAFAQDATLIRAISRHDFNVKHPVSFVFATYKLASS